MTVIGAFLEQAIAQARAAGTAAVTQHALDLANSRTRLFDAAAAIRASQPAPGFSGGTRTVGPVPADTGGGGGVLASIPKPVLIGGVAAIGLVVLIAIAKRKKKQNPRHFRSRARRRRRSRR